MYSTLAQIRFYWIHSNLDNSQLLHTIKLTSPVVKVNLFGSYLVLALRDCHVTIYSLSSALVPSKGQLVCDCMYLSVIGKCLAFSLPPSFSLPLSLPPPSLPPPLTYTLP